MADADIVFKSGTELASLIKTRQLSSVELVRAYLARIDALNPKLNAFITITSEEAIARARQADKEIAAGRYRGPLHGLPYAPKDILATKGLRTTNGSKVTPDWVPAHESTITSRLNQAGAILNGHLAVERHHQVIRSDRALGIGRPFGAIIPQSRKTSRQSGGRD